MRLKYKWSILIVCVLLFCTACSQSDNEVSERIGYDFPQSFNVEIDENIKFNTEIIVNEKVREHGLYYTTATIQKKDDDKAYNILFDGIEIVNNFEKSMEGGKEVYYQGADSESLFMTPTTLFMSKPLFYYIVNSFDLEEKEKSDIYLTNTEFDFMGIDEAYQEIKKIVSDFGIDIQGTYTCYSLDYQTMEKHEYVLGRKGKENKEGYKDEWSEADSGYYFTVHQILQDCIVQYPLADVFCEISNANAPIQVFYTEDGIQMMDIEKVFSFKQTEEKIELKNFDDIADVVASKYSMLLTDSQYEIVKAELFWRPIQVNQRSYNMVPAWEITIIEKPSLVETKMYINASTAEEIV